MHAVQVRYRRRCGSEFVDVAQVDHFAEFVNRLLVAQPVPAAGDLIGRDAAALRRQFDDLARAEIR
jgi:hypothetical protein